VQCEAQSTGLREVLEVCSMIRLLIELFHPESGKCNWSESLAYIERRERTLHWSDRDLPVFEN
jgi:hypothetical protein